MSWLYFASGPRPQLHVRWHYHPEYEITLISRGSGTRFVGDSVKAYQPGDLVLLGPNLPHTVQSGAGQIHDVVSVQFRRDFLGPDLFDCPDLASVRGLLDRARSGLAFDYGSTADARYHLQQCGKNPASPARRTVALLNVLVALSEKLDARPLASPAFAPALRPESQRRMIDICNYIDAHYRKHVTVEDVARAAHMSPSAFSSFFRRSMGRTLTGYLDELRIGMACRLLLETDLTVGVIAGHCGFENLSNFNRRFRHLKDTTPTQYRARSRFGAFDDAEHDAVGSDHVSPGVSA